MRIFRALLSLLLALLWVPATNSCVIAATWPGLFPAACSCAHGNDEGTGGEEKREKVPCGSQDCSSCATLESGVNLAALTPAVVPPAAWHELAALSQMLKLREKVASGLLAEPPPTPPVSPPRAVSDVVSMALPVRGPSLAI